MLKHILSIFFLSVFFISACGPKNNENDSLKIKIEKAPFVWEAANVYFLLTDRFNNGNPDNDLNFNRTKKTGKLRGFMGGDIKGITDKINDGYFNRLGINAIWFSPVFEQIHGAVNEGTGNTYAFHGYWIRDWTSLEPNFGTEEDLTDLVETAHEHGIRIIMDVVVNHTGPVTKKDPVWPNDWVRTKPPCSYKDYKTTVECTLVKNLPDIKTESNKNVELPEQLIEKWKKEGRYLKELKELDEFFESTGYPRAPRYYIIKWLLDLIKKYGVDAYRVDTAKHTEESVWADLYEEAVKAFNLWKKAHPDKVLDKNPFFMLGEVYGYGISGKQIYNFSDRKVNYFKNGFNSLINFEFKYDAKNDYEDIFTKYSGILNKELKGKTVMNYLSSHDDGSPFDKNRVKTIEAGTKLLLCPGQSQVYYGDETARPLNIAGAEGDASLRSFMNWGDLNTNSKAASARKVLVHWQKLGKFRCEHPAVGAGVHKMISEKPYFFTRTYQSAGFKDVVLVGLDLSKGVKEIDVHGIYAEGSVLKDYYSGKLVKVKDGKISLSTDYDIVLFASYSSRKEKLKKRGH